MMYISDHLHTPILFKAVLLLNLFYAKYYLKITLIWISILVLIVLFLISLVSRDSKVLRNA